MAVSKQYRVRRLAAQDNRYNLAIPNVIPNSVSRAHRRMLWLRIIGRALIVLVGCAVAVAAADWNGPEQELANNILAVTGPGAVSLSFENRSSLGRRDSDIIQNGIRSALQGLGITFAQSGPGPTAVTITLSENASSYVWVAQVKPSAGDSSAVMVSTPRSPASMGTHDSVPLSLRKTLLWEQADPILDLAVLEESTTPTRVAVLAPERVSLFRLQGGKWQQEQSLQIEHMMPWPRDLRGRAVAATDHLLDVYLPGVMCRTSGTVPLSLACHQSDEPWPLRSSSAGPGILAAFASGRNFFTGAVPPATGNLPRLPPFYSAAGLPRESAVLWIIAGVDRQVHVLDGVNDRILTLSWGSDVAGVRTSCGAGWQVLATSSTEETLDSVRAYEFPDRDPVAVSAAVDFSGAISALWTETRGDTAIGVTRNQETGNYEAFRLAVACSQ